VKLVELKQSRELFLNLTMRELRGKYKRSVLGWAWSMLNPLSSMLIYTFVFGVVLKGNNPPPMANGRSVFAMYLLCGLLPWNFFAATTSGGMTALVGMANLVKKVWFPREILVFALSGAGLVQFGIELSLLTVALLAVGNMVLPWLVPVLVISVLLVAFAVGIALLLAATYVYFRDLAYLWSIFVQMWFFLTPIVYPATLVSSRKGIPRFAIKLYNANPMAVFVDAYRHVLYHLSWPTGLQMLYLVVLSIASMAIGLRVFARLSPRFAEEL
jgi:ABC-type polysaccharide/polyol phosphate export permease